MSEGERLLTADELFSKPGQPGRVPYSRQHGERLERRGEFPQRIQVGVGRVAWRQVEIDDWIRNRPRGLLQFRGRGKAA